MNNELGKVIKIEFAYKKRADSNPQVESFEYNQELIVEGEVVKTIDTISNGSVITKEYRMAGENFCDIITDIGIGDKPLENVSFINYDPSYTLKITYENGVKEFGGAYNENDVPKNWIVLLISIFDTFIFHSFGLMFGLESGEYQNMMNKIRYLEVLPDGASMPLFFKTIDDSIDRHENVKFRAEDGTIKVGKVTDVITFGIGRAPFNLKRSKFIIGRA